MRNEQPRYALVTWPDAEQSPCCVTLEVLANALSRGAKLVASEADILPMYRVNAPCEDDSRTEDGA